MPKDFLIHHVFCFNYFKNKYELKKMYKYAMLP
jgi:hypothetical protein